MKVIALVPIKNEEWILHISLPVLSLFCDHIIVGDASSIDASVEICKRFPKVTLLHNPFATGEGNHNRRQILLDKAREIASDAIIFCFDADEIPTANILDNRRFWGQVNNLKPAESLKMEFINLWRSTKVYRDDASVWCGQYKPFAFRDDGKTNFPLGDHHEPKIPPGFEKNYVTEEEVKVLHYNPVLWERMISHQAHCRMLERKFLKRPVFLINLRNVITKQEIGLKTTPVPENWVEAYKKNGIDTDAARDLGLYWYDVEVLREFEKLGVKFFKWLDIWDIDWEKKRQLALAKGFTGIPLKPIKDPTNFMVRAYHKLIFVIEVEKIMPIYVKLKNLF